MAQPCWEVNMSQMRINFLLRGSPSRVVQIIDNRDEGVIRLCFGDASDLPHVLCALCEYRGDAVLPVRIWLSPRSRSVVEKPNTQH